MGFLDHSTNNIIIDAVLTDTGRSFLSRNDGSFSIVKFALGDDEIDYTIIEKFGRTVGKEKVEKNTPVFEAQTLGNIALKYKLVSVSNPNLVRLPSLTLSSDAGLETNGQILSMTRTGSGASRRLTLSQQLQDESVIDVELRDQVFIIKVPHRFLQVSGQTPDHIDINNLGSYILRRDASMTSIGGSRITLDLETKSITDAQFTVYGNVGNKDTISTVVTVTGIQSGAVKDFNVDITK